MQIKFIEMRLIQPLEKCFAMPVLLLSFPHHIHHLFPYHFISKAKSSIKETFGDGGQVLLQRFKFSRRSATGNCVANIIRQKSLYENENMTHHKSTNRLSTRKERSKLSTSCIKSYSPMLSLCMPRRKQELI